MYLRLLSIALFTTLLFSCNKSEDKAQLPVDSPQSVINFDSWATEKGLSLTSELATFNIIRSDDCQYSFDCISKTINLPKDETYDEEMLFQALGQCLLNRDIEEEKLHKNLLTSIMQIKFDPCSDYQCATTIPFFGIYKDYYIDELFDKTVDIVEYDLTRNTAYSDLPIDSLLYENCDEITSFESYNQYFLSYIVKPISFMDTIRFSNLLSFSDINLNVFYSTAGCESLIGVMTITESFERKYYHLGNLSSDIQTLLNDGFTISYYMNEGNLSLFINEELVRSIETGKENIENLRSWISIDQAEIFGNNCDLFELGDYKD